MTKRRGTKQNKRKTKQKIFFNILFVLFFFCYVPRKDQLTAGSSIYVICFFILFLLVNSSELHWFIHSHGFAVQFERNHVLSTKKILKITVKVFFYLPNILY